MKIGSMNLLSPSSIGATGGIMTVAGKGFSPEDVLTLGVTSSQYVSSAVIMLEVAAGVAGEYISYFEGEPWQEHSCARCTNLSHR